MSGGRPMIQARFAAGIILVLCGGLPAIAEDLPSVVEDAYLYNPSIDAARAALLAQGEGVAIANAGRLPTVSLSSSYGVSRRWVPDPLKEATTAPLSLGLSGSIPLYDGGRTANNVSQARANVDASYAQLIAQEQSTILNAVSAYFDVLRDKEVRNLTVDSLRLLVSELEASEARFEAGEVTITDVAQTKARVAAANASVIQADGTLRASAEGFRSVVGRLPGALDPPEFLPELPPSARAAEDVGVASHPTIRAARSAERAAVYNIRVINADKLPTVSFGSSLDGRLNDTTEGFGARLDNQLTAGVTLTLNAPIYQGGQVDSRIRQAQHIASQRRADYHVAVREVQRSVNVAWQTYVTARGAIEAGNEQVRAAQIAFDGIREELLVGSRATIDVLNAEQSLLDARTSLVNSVRQLNVAAYSLLSAMGKLGPDVFGLASVTGDEAGTARVEPLSPYGIVNAPEAAWRLPWRP